MTEGAAASGPAQPEPAAPRPESPGPDLADIYAASYESLVRLAMFMLGGAQAAEDVVQEVFARLAAQPPRLDDSAKLPAYVGRMVVNGCRSVRRPEAIAARLPFHRAATVGSAEVLAFTAFQRDDLVLALRQLSRRKREVVVLRYYRDLSERQVAELLKISVGSVKALASRGLADLAALMGVAR